MDLEEFVIDNHPSRSDYADLGRWNGGQKLNKVSIQLHNLRLLSHI